MLFQNAHIVTSRWLLIIQILFWAIYSGYIYYLDTTWMKGIAVFWFVLIKVGILMSIIYGHLRFYYLFENRAYLKYSLLLILLLSFYGLGQELLFFIRNNNRGWSGGEYELFEKFWRHYLKGATLLMLGTPVLYAFKYLKSQAQHQALQIQHDRQVLQYLQLQINPHFLFNALNNLLLFIRKSPEKAIFFASRIHFLVDYFMNFVSLEKVALSQEVEVLQAYLTLEGVRSAYVQTSLNFPDNHLNIEIPPLLFLPLVENAFKHGSNREGKPNNIFIQFHVTGPWLYFEVTNNCETNSVVTKSGYGLNNLKERLKLLYKSGDYSLKHGMEKPGEYKAQLKIAI